MRTELKTSLKAFCLELMVYAGLVAVYFFLVLHFLGGWLHRLFASDRHLYAVVALALIVGQGLVLEVLTRLLLNFLKPHVEEE